MSTLAASSPTTDPEPEYYAPRRRGPGRTIALILAKICVAFLVLIPKGGFKLGPAPITWGYLMLGVCAGLCLVAYGLGGRLSLSKRRIMALILTFPMGAMTVYGYMMYRSSDLPIFAGFLISSFILPLLLVFFLGAYFDRNEDLPEVLDFLKTCIFLVACYGILLFVYFVITKRTFEIPFITTNGSDTRDIALKHNMRGDVMKLIATYNNGNIYGVSTLILFPLYRILEKRTWRVFVVRAALVLTLSRTVWLGLFLAEFFFMIFQSPLNLKRIFGFVAVIVLAVSGIAGTMSFLGKDILWMLDSRLGGRQSQLEVLEDPTLLPERAFSGTREMTYLTMMNQYGILGLTCFMILLSAPLLALFKKGRLNRVQTACLGGCVIYWCVAFLDGAYVLIPVMAFFWLACSLAISSNPALDDV